MSESIGLCAHVLRVRKLRARDDVYSEIRRNVDPDVWTLSKDFLLSLRAKPWSSKGVSKEYATRRMLRLHDRELSIDEKEGTISGLVECGEFGRTSRIVDSSTATEKYKRGAADANVEPFYFQLRIPDGGETRVILVCQQNGIFGPSAAIRRALHEQFAQKDWLLEDSPLQDSEMLDHYLKRGITEKIVVRAYKLTRDKRTLLANSKVAGERLPVGTSVELVLKRKDGFLSAAKRKLGRKQIAELVEVSGLKHPDEVAVSIKDPKTGRTKSFRLIHPTYEPVIQDISADISYDKESHHPSFESIHKIASEWCSEVWEKLD